MKPDNKHALVELIAILVFIVWYIIYIMALIHIIDMLSQTKVPQEIAFWAVLGFLFIVKIDLTWPFKFFEELLEDDHGHA